MKNHFDWVPDEIVCKILADVPFKDKLQSVQLTCRRFRELLRHPPPSATPIWGSLHTQIIAADDQLTSLAPFGRRISWLLARIAGVAHVHATCADFRDDDNTAVADEFHALAGATAAAGTPLHLTLEGETLSFARETDWPDHVIADLSRRLHRLHVLWDSSSSKGWDPGMARLRALTALKHLDIFMPSRPSMERRTVSPGELRPGFPMLESLRLSGGVPGDVELLLACAAASPQLTKLQLEHYTAKTSDVAIKQLPPIVTTLKSLKDLGIGGNHLTALQPLSSLHALTLLHVIGDAPLENLPAAIAGCVSLQVLGIEWPARVDQALIDSITSLPALKEVRIDDIEVGDWPKHAYFLGVLMQKLQGMAGPLRLMSRDSDQKPWEPI